MEKKENGRMDEEAAEAVGTAEVAGTAASGAEAGTAGAAGVAGVAEAAGTAGVAEAVGTEWAAATAESVEPHPSALWRGDTGTLHEDSRRVLLELLKGPYVSGAQSPGLWAALAADETEIRSRLHDLFLDLVIDRHDEFAFTRKVETHEVQAPSALRSERLTFLDTAMLLVLRQFLLAAPGEERVIVGQDEVYEQLSVYREGDESTFLRNLNGSWGRMLNKLRVLHSTGEDRVEISPMIRFLVDEDRVRELTAVYRRIAGAEEDGTEQPGTPPEDGAEAPAATDHRRTDQPDTSAGAAAADAPTAADEETDA